MRDPDKVAGTLSSTIDIPKQRVVDLFISACEGGSNYWCRDLTPKRSARGPYAAMLNGFRVTLLDQSGGTLRQRVVTRGDVMEAIKLMAQKEPRAFGAWLSEDDDAATGDVFLQLCVFKEVIYG